MDKQNSIPETVRIVCTCCMCGMVHKNGVWVRDEGGPDVSRTYTHCPTCLGELIRQSFPGCSGSKLGKRIA